MPIINIWEVMKEINLVAFYGLILYYLLGVPGQVSHSVCNFSFEMEYNRNYAGVNISSGYFWKDNNRRSVSVRWY